MVWRPVLVLLVLMTACSGADSTAPGPAPSAGAAPSGPTTPTMATATSPPTTSPAPTTTGVAPSGFDTVAGRVTATDGRTCDVCLWAAVTSEQQQRGLMGVTELGGADGMVFRFGAPTTIRFWMRNTPTPLSIAFFAEDGAFVSASDMKPCLNGPDEACARYEAAGPYADAVEVARGELPDLLIGPGARLEISDDPCPLAP